ncbi:MAG TPA: carboxypeptidase-like regulatory domain-containing protein [Blastocatellia bacterium]|nr:carboxypeptidase-like regulatory domain-containing protein [Blastocatellia bacterium]
MHALARVLLLMALTLSAPVSAPSQSVSPQSKEVNAAGTISGRVTIAGKPAANIPVAVMPDPQRMPRGRIVGSSTTDADGHFQITHVPAGRFYVRAVAPVFYNEAEGNDYPGGSAITLADGETVEDIHLALRRGGVITGRVTEETGRPLIQEYIHLYRINPRDARHEPYNRNYTVMQTDDRGIYRIYGLPPGRYLVSAGIPAGRDGSASMSRGNSYYPQTFYPSVRDEAKAGEVEVTEGGEATGIDLALGHTEKSYTALVRVVADSGKPVAGARCGYGTQDQNGRFMGISAIGPESNADGQCRIEGVVPGKYVAFVVLLNETSPAYANGPPSPAKAQSADNYTFDPAPFEITDSDVSDVEIKLRAGASVSGTVVIEGLSEQEAATHFRELNLNVAMEGPITTPRFNRPQINADGSFRIGGLAAGRGRVYLSSFLGRNFRLLRVEREGADLTAGFDLDAGENLTGLRLVVGFGTGVIRGEVKFADGPLPAGFRAFVTVRRVGDSPPQNAFAQVDARGHFVVEDLLPGEYTLTAGSRSKPVNKTVSVTNDNEAQVTIVLERPTGNNQ